MKRVQLTGEDTGKWFDEDAAVKFTEATRWDGRNHISRATGSQWEHEVLYFTRGGRWVLNHWSQWQGSLESYSEVTADEAARWLINNECLADAEYDKLPAEVRAEVEKLVEAQEV